MAARASSPLWRPPKRRKPASARLKIGYNKVFGYLHRGVQLLQGPGAGGLYIRKQTLVNGERYITQELKDLEHDILSASDRVSALEYEICSPGLRQQVSQAMWP